MTSVMAGSENLHDDFYDQDDIDDRVMTLYKPASQLMTVVRF